MAAYVFSSNPNTAFDPTKDLLQIDTTGANKLRVNQIGSNVVITDGTNTATLQNVVIAQLSTANVNVTNGSVLLVGDNFSGVAFDDAANSLVGTGLGDRLQGLGGADSIDGAGGADLIYGNLGADSIYTSVAAGADTVYGGQGNDALNYGTATAAGTLGVNASVVSTGNLLIYGNLGDDVITSGLGNDAIYGGQGNDAVTTGGGNDLVYGNLGNDAVTISAGAAADRIRVYGGQGDDIVAFGGATLAQATIYGNLGNDQLTGSFGGDVIYGGQGADSITGGFGADVMTGGLGADTFRFFGGDSGIETATADVIRDFVTGTDKIAGPSGAGSFANYQEFSTTTATSVESALTAYQTGTQGRNYNFIAGPTDGYLILDADGNQTTGADNQVVKLTGVNTLAGFDFTDIIA